MPAHAFSLKAMSRLLVTGASGYIGTRLCEVAQRRGVEVVCLGTAPAATMAPAIAWRLGMEVPPGAFEGVAAVIHLGHSWASDSEHGISASNTNLSGSEYLARAALAAGVPRFIFASTVSARSDALNAYGRIKHELERRLLAVPGAEGLVVCARIGLVYGGREQGMYGLLSKIVRLTPILPMVSLERNVQPIFIDEVVSGLLALSTNPLPRRDGAAPTTYILAGPTPITFGSWLKLLRRAHTGRRLLLLPIPLRAALLACDLTQIVPFIPRVGRERVLGLAGTAPMDSAGDLAALGIEILPTATRLASSRAERKRKIREAKAMLRYVSGGRTTGKAAVARLVRGIERKDPQSLSLPRLVISCPGLLRIFEPLRPRPQHRLVQRLHLAAMVVESAPQRPGRRRTTLSILGLLAVEAIALPFRLVLGEWFA